MKELIRILMISVACSALTFEYIPETLDPPSRRLYQTLTMNNNTLFLFGGQRDNSNNFNDMWIYPISDGKWSIQTTASQIYPSNLYSVERFSHGAFEIQSDSLVCIFGGANQYGPLNDLWCFNIKSTSWELMTTDGDHVEPRYRFGFTSYEYNGTFYFAVFGGHSKEGRLNDIAILNTETWEWKVYNSTQGSNVPFKRNGCMMAYHNNYLYVVGGVDETAQAKTADFFRFSIENYQWENLTNSASTYEPVILSGIVVLNDILYLIFGWDTVNGVDRPNIFKVNLTSTDFEWTEAANFPDIKRDAFGYTLVGSKVYIFGGYTAEALMNNLVVIDMSAEPFTYTQTQSQTTPSLRVSHSMEAINDKLYVFGGDTNGEKLNDLWCFDVLTDEWESLNSNGLTPLPRSHHGSASLGDNMIVWGGHGANGLMNDMYKYSVSSNNWEELVAVSTKIPAPRSSPCLVLINPFIYLYGGMTETRLSSELWQFDIGSGEYTLLSNNNYDGPGAIHKHKCYYETIDGEDTLYVIFGTGTADSAQGKVHAYTFSTGKWSLLATSSRPRNGALVNKINHKILIGGGETWGIYLFKDLFYIDLSTCNPTCEEKDIGELDLYFSNGANGYSLNYLFFHGGSSPLSDIHRATVPSSAQYKLDLFTACPSCQWECSLGSEIKDQSCVYCPRGYYSELYSSPCEPCVEGFYNEKTGARSIKQCFPCSEGSFNPDKGAYYCLDCPAFATCSIGSSRYIFQSPESEEYTQQPLFYESQADKAAEISSILILATAVIGGTAIIAFVFWSKLNKFLTMFDLFDKLHTYGEGNVVTLTKNKIGGTFGLIFMVVALILVMSTIPGFILDNLAETKTLVPYIILADTNDFFSRMLISVELDDYHAPCDMTDNSCHTSIIYTVSQIENQTELELSCFKEGSICKVYVECEVCSIDSSSEISFLFTDSLSYTSGIMVNITTFSSIPDSYSSASYHIYSSDDTVFRGTPATEFYFSLITSLFQNSMDGSEETGYHSMLSKIPQPGASHSTIDVPFTSDLQVNIQLTRSENSLMTLHEEKIPVLILFITLLGSVSGALGAIGAGMSTVEKMYGRLYNRYSEKKKEDELIRNRLNYKTFLTDGSPNKADSSDNNNAQPSDGISVSDIRSQNHHIELKIDNLV